MAIGQYILQLVSDPQNWEMKTYQDFKNYPLSSLKLAFPAFSQQELDSILAKTKEFVPTTILSHLKKYKLEDAPNFEFLALLGQKRNWKDGCVICLTDNIMGTTCQCGHTEIAVFRPCGHGVCVSPCLRGFLANKGVKFNPKTIKFNNGNSITIPAKIDVKDVIGLQCPVCRTVIKDAFRDENVISGANIDDVIIDGVSEGINLQSV